jgi:hypothetical protein
VQGLPEGARIVFDGARIPENPFRVRRTSLYVPLRVEADGFEPYTTSVMPDADKNVVVELKPSVAAGAASAAGTGEGVAGSPAVADGRKKHGGKAAAREPTSDPTPAAEPVPAAKKAAKTLGEGRRGSLVSDDFD